MFVKQKDIYIYQGSKQACIRFMKDLSSHQSYLQVDNEHIPVNMLEITLEPESHELEGENDGRSNSVS